MSEIPGNEPASLSLLPWQSERWAELVERRRTGRFPHALLISGPAGIGKTQFTRRLATALVCEVDDPAQAPCGQCQACRLAGSGTHPDIVWVSPEEEGKQIRIEAIRTLIGRSGLTTQARGMRVFVITPADAMNPAAANALLKTLEEPPPSSCLVLVSTQPHRLPQTIRSRCQRIAFRPVADEMARDWLAGQTSEEGGEAALAAAGGAPLAALQLLESDELKHTAAALQDLQELARRQVNPVDIAQRWASEPVGRQLARLRRVLFDMGRYLAHPDAPRLYLPQLASDLQKSANDINLQGLFEYLDEINRLEREMTHNLNPGMLMEKLVTDWLSLTRPEKH